MRRLNGVDALMLYLDGGSAYNHTLKISVLDPSTDPDGWSWPKARQMFEERAHLLPVFRLRYLPTPLGLHHPIWVEDPEFDLDAHVRRVVCPPRAGWRNSARSSSRSTPTRWIATARCGRPGWSRASTAAASPWSRCCTTPTPTASACWTCSPRSTTTRLTRPPWLRPRGAAAAAVHPATPRLGPAGPALQARQDRADRAGRS